MAKTRAVAAAVLAASAFTFTSCSSGSDSQCAPGLYPYKGDTCLDAVSQNFVSCTDTRGQNLTTEERQKFGLSVTSAAKITGGSGVVELSKKIVQEELPEVTIEIVRDCLELSKQVPEAAGQQAQIDSEIASLQSMLDAVSEGSVSVDPSSGPYRQALTVSGSGWPANVELEVAAVTTRVRVTTSADGTFSTPFSLPTDFEQVAPDSIEIRVSPVKASTMLPAGALYTVSG